MVQEAAAFFGFVKANFYFATTNLGKDDGKRKESWVLCLISQRFSLYLWFNQSIYV